MQIKPEYEINDEFVTLAKRLTEKYPSQFYGKPVDVLRSVTITNKDRPNKKKMAEVRAVPMPVAMDCPYKFYVIVYSSDWDAFNPKQKQALVADVLFTLPDGADEEKLVQPDLKDHSVVLRTLGVDYMQSTELPDLLVEDIEWQTSPR